MHMHGQSVENYKKIMWLLLFAISFDYWKHVKFHEMHDAVEGQERIRGMKQARARVAPGAARASKS